MKDVIILILYVSTIIFGISWGLYWAKRIRQARNYTAKDEAEYIRAVMTELGVPLPSPANKIYQESAEDLRRLASQFDQYFAQTSNPLFNEKAKELREVADQFALLARTGTCAYSTEELTNKLRRIQAEIDQLPTHP